MKIEKESPKKNGNTGYRPEDVAKMAEDRKQLLARVAGDVASGLVSAPSELTATAAGIAEISVDIAEEILKRAGL